MSKPLKSYTVRVEYRGTVTVEVEAANAEEAENKALPEADEAIRHNLSVYGVDVEGDEGSET